MESEVEAQEAAGDDEELEASALNMHPTVRCEVSRAQLERFYAAAAIVIESGRPPKPSKNGHYRAN